MLLCGELNKNLKQIEKALKIKVIQNGTEFNISGNQDDVEMGVSALFDLKQKLETNSVITPDLIHLSLHTAKFSDAEKADSKEVHIKTPRASVTARGKNQKEYLTNIASADLTFGVGPSGTGKTFLAVARAVDDLIKEIPEIRKDVGYIPLVTPTSQIIGAQALLNVLDNSRYKNLNKEFIDLVNGKYGKIPGEVNKSLLKIIDSKNYEETSTSLTVNDARREFKKFCKDKSLKDLYSNNTDLLNYILFPKESKDFYNKSTSMSMNDLIELQEGFGFYLSD